MHTRPACRVLAAFLALPVCAGAAPPAASAGPGVLQLMVYDRPPLIALGPDGSAQGTMGLRLMRVLERAALPFAIVKVPARRQLMRIAADDGPVCGVGWLRTAARQSSGVFSAPLYRSGALVALMRAQSSPLPATLAQLLADRKRVILVKGGLSYGETASRLLSAGQARLNTVTSENADMLEMLARGHGDAMLLTREEAEFLYNSYGERKPALQVLELADVPQGEARHLYCSSSVGAATLAQLNQAIAAEKMLADSQAMRHHK